MRYSYVKKATAKFENARINFSGAGIPVREYRYSMRRITDTRAQILVAWVGGGTKVAAGFINPLGKSKMPLSSRSQKAARGGKVYTYRKRKMTEALGPSLATAYLALPENEVAAQASTVLSAELVALLDDLLGE